MQDLTALVRLKQAPWDRIESAEETCDISANEMKREVSLTIAPVDKGAPSQPELVLVDVLQPRKGELVDIEILGGNSVRRVSHDRHLDVSVQLIVARFASAVTSTIFVGGPPPADFAAALAPVLGELQSLPHLPVAAAVELVGKNFNELGILRAIPEDGSARVDVEQMQGLYEICKLLATRYLVLVETHVSHTESWTLRYEYSQLVRVSPDHNDFHGEKLPFGIQSRSSSRRPRSWFRARVRRIFGAPPTWVRVHTPLAKQTDHYALRVVSPQNHFFSRVVVLEDLPDREDIKPPKSATALSTLSRDIRVAVSYNRGVAPQCFVGGGREASNRVYVGLVTKELPNHSAFRAALVLGITTAVLVAFTVLAMAGATAITDVASLVVALLSIGYLIVEAVMPRAGLQGAPVLSGVLIAGSSLLSVLFCIWLVSLSAEGPAPEWMKPTPWDWLEGLWVWWIDWGAVTLAVLAFGSFLLALYRCWVISSAFVKVSEIEPRYSNMYVN